MSILPRLIATLDQVQSFSNTAKKTCILFTARHQILWTALVYSYLRVRTSMLLFLLKVEANSTQSSAQYGSTHFMRTVILFNSIQSSENLQYQRNRMLLDYETRHNCRRFESASVLVVYTFFSFVFFFFVCSSFCLRFKLRVIFIHSCLYRYFFD